MDIEEKLKAQLFLALKGQRRIETKLNMLFQLLLETHQPRWAVEKDIIRKKYKEELEREFGVGEADFIEDNPKNL